MLQTVTGILRGKRIPAIPGDALPLRDDFPGIVLVCQFLVFIVASADRYWKDVHCTCGVGDTFLEP